jgi:hypothetical protein
MIGKPHCLDRSQGLARRSEARPRTAGKKMFLRFGLRWANASKEEIRKVTQELLAEQRNDGGWSQLPHRGNDADATGEVRVSLDQAGGGATSEAADTPGFLDPVGARREDDSWLLQPRMVAFPPYFDAGSRARRRSLFPAPARAGRSGRWGWHCGRS